MSELKRDNNGFLEEVTLMDTVPAGTYVLFPDYVEMEAAKDAEIAALKSRLAEAEALLREIREEDVLTDYDERINDFLNTPKKGQDDGK
jgi:hypothetical protein